MDLELTGFSEDDCLKRMPESPKPGRVDDDCVPAPPKDEPVCCPGDLWLLGEHRLLCGDATKRDPLSGLMAGRQADLVWVDPPYNVDYQGATDKKLTLRNDRLSDTAFRQFLEQLFRGCHQVSKAGAPIYVCYADSEAINVRSALQATGWKLSQTLIWLKHHFTLSRQDYHWQHEPILYGWKDDGAHPWYGGATPSTLLKDEPPLDDMSRKELLTLCRAWRQTLALSVLPARKPMVNAEHPTMKPVYLVMRMIMNSSQRGDTVLDPCGGSGSTLIACEKLQRHACLVEIDPRYCDVILQRWQAFTGSSAVHADTQQPFPGID